MKIIIESSAIAAWGKSSRKKQCCAANVLLRKFLFLRSSAIAAWGKSSRKKQCCAANVLLRKFLFLKRLSQSVLNEVISRREPFRLHALWYSLIIEVRDR